MRMVKILNLGVLLGLITIFCTSTVLPSPNSVITATWASSFRPHGAYVDEVVFKVYSGMDEDQVMLDLQNGVIDAYDEHIQDTYVPSLTSNPDIAVNNYLIPAYRHLTLNCGVFPTNITGFRRAIAFIMDKNKANNNVTGGIGAPLDSYITTVATEWEIESTLSEHFYDKDIIAGNASLEASGFKDLDNDGWREYDVNGNDVWDTGVDIDNVTCNFGASIGQTPDINCSQIAVDGLNEMGINSKVIEGDFSFLLDNFKAGLINSICFRWLFNPIDPAKKLFLFFRSGEIYHEMFYNLNNATIDAALDDMMAATTLAEAKTKTAVAAEYLVYEQPMIVCYNDAHTNAYRTDKFEGFSSFSGYGWIGDPYGNNPYAATKVRTKASEGGPFGGTFRCSFRFGWETTNILQVTESFSLKVLNYIYESLWQLDPVTWDPIPALAYDWTIEQTTAGGGFQDGQKFTFQLYPNATWHDGQPITSADVKYSFETIWPTSSYHGSNLANIYRIDTPDTYTVHLYSNQMGYFEWGSATGLPVLPKHIWETQGPDFQNWVPSTAAEMVGSGPYKWNNYIPNDYTSLIRHPYWHFSVLDITPPIVNIDSPTETTYTTNTITVILSGDALEYVEYWYYIAGVDSSNQTWTDSVSRTLADGTYTLHAYGNDTTGNVAHVSVTFTIEKPASEDDKVSFGFGLFTTLILISGATTVCIKRRRK